MRERLSSRSRTPPVSCVAEPRRRQILTLLRRGEHSVNDLARSLRVRQPQASKHLRVLKEVGLVKVREEGQQRMYTLHDDGLKPIHDWVTSFAQFRSEIFERLDQYLEDLK